MGLRMKDFLGLTKKSDIQGEGEFSKNQYIRGDCLKRGPWIACMFSRWKGKKRGGDVFEGEGC